MNNIIKTLHFVPNVSAQHSLSQRKIIYVCVCVCLWHVSMRIFNLFMIPLRKIRLRAFVSCNRHQQSTRMKVH